VHCWEGDPTGLAEPLSAHVAAIPLPGDALDVNVSERLACAVLTSGTVHCWGSNGSGQLGAQSRLLDSELPLQVVGVRNARSVSVADDHACVVESDGTVACWGDNSTGQCGHDEQYTPAVRHLVTAQPVAGVSGAVSVATGTYSSCAIGAGRAWCWGEILRPTQAAPSAENRARAALVPPLAKAVQLLLASSCGCALFEGGSVACFPIDAYGCRGTDPRIGVTPRVALVGVERLTLANGAACAVLADGTLSCWAHPEPRSDPPSNAQGLEYQIAATTVGQAPGIEELSLGQQLCVRRGNALSCWRPPRAHGVTPALPRSIQIQ